MEVAGEEPSAAAEPSSAPSDAPKNVDAGETLPSLVIKNEKGEDVDTASLTAEKGVVLFLVPKADTREYLVARSLMHEWTSFWRLPGDAMTSMG